MTPVTEADAAAILRLVPPDTLSTMCRLSRAEKAELWELHDGQGCAACGAPLRPDARRGEPGYWEASHQPALSRMTPSQLSGYSQPGGFRYYVAVMCSACNQAGRVVKVAPVRRVRRSRYGGGVPAWAPVAHALVNAVTGRSHPLAARLTADAFPTPAPRPTAPGPVQHGDPSALWDARRGLTP
jgi:hypothetical protein